MAWDIEYTDEFETWWETLSEGAQIDVDTVVGLLQECGTNLPFPHSSGVTGSRHSHMRELRIQHAGGPYRVLYAFDPRRKALLLVGGSKWGDDRWYEKAVPIADRIYDQHLQELKRRGGVSCQNNSRS